MSIRIGIAGCGSHALGRILPLLEQSTVFDLGAVWSRNPATQAQLLDRGVGSVYGNFSEFLTADVDVVYIASPTGCHFEHASAVLRAGRHAWVEKPLASTLEDARHLLVLAAHSERMLVECFMFTWHEQAQAIRKALAQGLLGELRTLSLTFCFPHLPDGNFRYDPALGGGAWLDHGCYLVKALACYFPGEWSFVGGCSGNEGYAVDIRGAAQLRRAADGLVANLNWGFGHSYVNEIQVIGTRGRMLVESAFTKPASRSCNILLEDTRGQRSTLAITPEDPYARMLEGLTGQLLAHTELFFSLQEMLKSANTLTAPRLRPHAE